MPRWPEEAFQERAPQPHSRLSSSGSTQRETNHADVGRRVEPSCLRSGQDAGGASRAVFAVFCGGGFSFQDPPTGHQ